jgi:hypothetical protein
MLQGSRQRDSATSARFPYRRLRISRSRGPPVAAESNDIRQDERSPRACRGSASHCVVEETTTNAAALIEMKLRAEGFDVDARG